MIGTREEQEKEKAKARGDISVMTKAIDDETQNDVNTQLLLAGTITGQHAYPQPSLPMATRASGAQVREDEPRESHVVFP